LQLTLEAARNATAFSSEPLDVADGVGVERALCIVITCALLLPFQLRERRVTDCYAKRRRVMSAPVHIPSA